MSTETIKNLTRQTSGRIEANSQTNFASKQRTLANFKEHNLMDNESRYKQRPKPLQASDSARLLIGPKSTISGVRS